MRNQSRKPATAARFDNKRFFFQSSLDGSNSGWYISITSERAYSPFPDKHVAQYILNGIVKRILDRRAARITDDEPSADMA
jgi:hypothetical protein